MTIFALSSGAGRAGIAVVRVSGAAAGEALRLLARGELPAPRTATMARFRHPESGEAIDDGLALWFPAPRSYTGEDVAEFHVHGGMAVVDALLEALGAMPGLRPAEAGEFTRRAFENGKLDLTQAEGVADLVNAETEAQRRQALRQAEGGLGRLYEGWRREIISALARLEAEIDFPDEDLREDAGIAGKHKIKCLHQKLTQHLDDAHRGERLREGFYVAILGSPNVGKSSLLNALARREAAIVSATAGTTRDVIEVHLDLGGLPVVVADTAGLRESVDAIEDEGVRRALERAAHADLKLVLFDAQTWPEVDRHGARLVDADAIVVLNKIDLAPLEGPVEVGGEPANLVSVATGTGMAALLESLEAAVRLRSPRGSSPALTRVRHRRALEACRAALERALEAAAPELAAEDARLAARELGRVTGRVDVEDILDIVFKDFCIGK